MEENYSYFNLKKDIDLIGLGNAIVDILVNVEDNFLEINALKKGSMNLINSNESEVLLKNCKVIKKISGGSSANTVVCLAELGNNVQFIGRVKNDNFGNFFSTDIKKSKTIFNTPPINKGPSSAHSIIFPSSLGFISSDLPLLITKEPLLPSVIITNSHIEEINSWQLCKSFSLNRLKTSDSLQKTISI